MSPKHKMTSGDHRRRFQHKLLDTNGPFPTILVDGTVIGVERLVDVWYGSLRCRCERWMSMAGTESGLEQTRRPLKEAPRDPASTTRPSLARGRLTIDDQVRGRLSALTEARRSEASDEGASEDYGLDLAFREKAEPLFRFLFEQYWRVTLDGLENVPESGGAILVGNHSGGLPFDATMVAYALSKCAGGPRRVVRPLYDKFVEGLGPIRDAYRKLGGVPARYSVADELLGRGELPLIFPEGMYGVSKLYEDRYRVGTFSTSAARLSCRHRVPVIPFAVVGAEEIYPMIGRSGTLGKLLGAPYVPITPFFPTLGLLGALPLPTKWRIIFGPRIYLYREHRFRGTYATDFGAMSERLRRTVQILLRSSLSKRSSIFFG